jgi:hypothetical protein
MLSALARDQIGPHDPVRLKVAAKLFFCDIYSMPANWMPLDAAPEGGQS